MISTHVPMRGTTTHSQNSSSLCGYFNPRPHAGDDGGGPDQRQKGRISTHVPMRGTTVHARGNTSAWRFQPTSPCGGRPSSLAPLSTVKVFQPTSPCGGRQRSMTTSSSISPFQPTSPCGGRRFCVGKNSTLFHFNPRPHAGDDSAPNCNTASLIISTHVPMRGTTRGKFERPRAQGNFNPRPHAGDDYVARRFAGIGFHFNPRPHAGDD